ncbi:MAG TPA: hypothetical protein PLR99_13375 [Polyangiaceae bacterium]|nr:hypothetical protein [Polyangiaceae bacterium]
MNHTRSDTRSDTDEASLPEDLLYAEDGHASDVVLTCLADGEDALVPAALRAHVLACEDCGAQLGNAALLSLRADDAVRGYVAARPRPAHSPGLERALALGFLVAVLSAAPRLASLPEELPRVGRALALGGPSYLRLLREAAWLGAHAARERGLWLSLFASLALVACAVWLARARARA